MKKRACIVKILWDKATPYIQLSGWAIMMGGIVLSGITLVNKAVAFDERLSSLEQKAEDLRLLNQKVDLIIEFLKIPKR